MIINLGDKSKAVTYKTNGISNCLELCKLILKKYGITSFGSSNNVFKLLYESNGKLLHYGSNIKENYTNAIECIDRHLKNNRPIIVGVNHTFGNTYNEGTTDHFVVIYGKGYDEKLKMYYYTYYEVGKTDLDNVYNDELNRFYYDDKTYNLYDIASSRSDKKRFDVIQVRPNDGILNGTVNHKQ